MITNIALKLCRVCFLFQLNLNVVTQSKTIMARLGYTFYVTYIPHTYTVTIILKPF